MSSILETIQLTISHIQTQFRFVTLMDIGLVSVFIYIAMVWFRETTSRLVYIGLAFIGGIYLFARLFDLFLTSLIFHVGFAVISLSLVIIFQDDIRRIIERIALWGMYGRRMQSSKIEGPIDLMVEVAFKLASLKWGALMVIQGRDPLSRYIQGGEILHGQISKALLLSLFDPHSAGHDGAVIIDKFKVEVFGAHLPLTTNPSQLTGFGTRHSAALGLSERTDAMILVISEELGEIRVAERGKLKRISSPVSLKSRLERFLLTHVQRPSIPIWKSFFRAHLGMKIASMFLATTIWVIFSYKAGSIVQRNFLIPIEFRNIATNMYVVSSEPHEVRATFSGKEAAFSLLNSDALKVSIEVGTFKKGKHVIQVRESFISHPFNLSINALEPRTVTIHLAETR